MCEEKFGEELGLPISLQPCTLADTIESFKYPSFFFGGVLGEVIHLILFIC